MCEGTLSGKRMRHGRGTEAAEVAGVRPPGGMGGDKIHRGRNGPTTPGRGPRPAQIPMRACENTRPERRASVKAMAMRTGATARCPARPVSVRRWFGASCWLGLGMRKGLGRGQLKGLGAPRPGPRPALGRRQCLRHAPLRGTVVQTRGAVLSYSHPPMHNGSIFYSIMLCLS